MLVADPHRDQQCEHRFQVLQRWQVTAPECSNRLYPLAAAGGFIFSAPIWRTSWRLMAVVDDSVLAALSGVDQQLILFAPISLGQSLKSQSGRQDSNLRPSAPKAEISGELPQRFLARIPVLPRVLG